jgi:hypothetical protein
MPRPPALTQSAPSPQLLAALPALRRLEEELASRLTPSMTATVESDGYSHVGWMTAKLLRFLLQAAATSDPAERQASLVEVEADAVAVIRTVHQLLAATVRLDELATAAAEQVLLDLDDTVVVHQADLVVSLPTGEYPDTAVPVAVRVDGGGRVTLASSSHVRFGRVDGQTQLGVTTALRTLGQALTGCWQPPEEA